MIPTIEHVQRWAEPFVDELVDEGPAILLEGPRGFGKSTLLRSIAKRRDALVLDLDDDSVLQLVQKEVVTALASPGLVAIHEFHCAPEVLSYDVKRVVDREGGAGRFVWRRVEAEVGAYCAAAAADSTSRPSWAMRST